MNIVIRTLGVAACLASSVLHAQAWPAKPIRVVVGTAPGGTTDTYARLISSPVERRIGQSFVVENKPGANGTIAAREAVKSAPDGYTLIFGGVGSVHPMMNKTNGVDPTTELAPITNAISVSFVLYGSGKLPARTLQEAVEYAKANPGKLNYASPSAPNLDLMMTMLKDRFGLDHLHVPYKGGAAVAAAMLSGESHLTIGSVGTYMAQVNAGGLRALLILGSRKPVQYPGIPSTADLGHDLFDGTASLIGFWAPMGTPAEIIGRLNEEFNRSVRSPELGDAFRKAAVDALGTTPQEQLRQAEAELRFLRAAIKIANYQPQ